ncbi:protein ECT2 isoform X12 [Planococcus citri]|uniref:protein ECT2 isoform X12 n=1 Tax=Planococcus citri TaxID=170843 RepID=UPI0031F743A7
MTTNRRFVVMKILYARLGSDFCFRMMYVNVFKTVNWIFKMDNLKIVCSKMPPHLILLKDVAEDTEVVRACELFKVPVTVAEDIQTNPAEDVLSIYVVNSFENVEANGANYRFHAPARKSRKPRRSKKNHRSYVGEKNFRILGRTAILEMAKKREELGDEYFPFSTITKPLYCHALSGQVICFTGFKKEDELLKLKLLVHHMGGSVRKEMHCKVTHLIAKLCSGEKYFYAMTFRVPVVSEMWVHDAWQNRNVIGFNAAENDFISQYKLKPFHGSRICFLGYPEEEKNHMIEVLRENGGEPTDIVDQNCTHLVVDETKLSAAPPLRPTSKTFVVKAEWFWTSVQNEGRENEKKFIFDVDSNATPQSLNDTPICATSSTRARKRKRLKDRFPSFGSDLSPGQSAQKRRSSACDVTRQSEGSFLDYTASPDFVDVRTEIESPSLEKSKNTARFHKFMELWQTETNYVGILRTIMTLFKASLEKMVDTEAQLLNATELKIIFGHLPPIYSAHCDMLEELKEMVSKWSDDISVGELILKYSDALVKAYPPFINFFENTREMLIRCDKTKPRFHAFLKVCQSKPECGRQSLQDLLIRPVQRLPSINLLLNDILRYTSKNSVDYKALEKAIASLQDVMAHINEDKRKTEGQVALFDIFNEIENCPAYLVSSHRCFISRCEVTELSDNLSGRGNPLVLFLFSDVIEVCKKRKAFNNLKSPKENSGSVSTRHNKLYKHVKLLPLNSVLKVIDINETEDCHNIFALRVKSCQDLKESKEKTYSFTITDECIQKTNYLRMLCSQIANIVCRTDTDSYLMYSEAHQFDIDSSEVATGTLGKAFKFATKTRIKVGRALSFNKTPNKLKRAVSTMMSPFGNQNGLTPSTQLANLQLAALPNIPVSYDENVN